MTDPCFDIIVVGGGHAGCEAAMAAANLGSSVLLISMDLDGFARMSCNPAVGGIAKGQIVREIDALGGYTGIVTDASTLQFRMLNRSKGPAMWSPRAQCDKRAFSVNWRQILTNHCKLSIYADLATAFLFENGKIAGVRTNTGAIFHSQAVILTAGTFLGGKLFVGQTVWEGGRIGEKASLGLTEQLAERGIPTARMKTGTPPRIDIRSVDTSRLPLQLGDDSPERFSFLPVPSTIQSGEPQLPCYICHTNLRVHEILRTGFDRSPLFTGLIAGKGPRYCPSIEDIGIQRNTTFRGSPLRCRSTSSSTPSMPSRALRMRGSLSPPMRSSMITSTRCISDRRWNPESSRGCIWPGRSTERPVMRKRPRRA